MPEAMCVAVTFVDLVRACYPVLIANDDETYWAGQWGTCFLAERGGRLFAITARHCVVPALSGYLRLACHERQFAPLRPAYQRTPAQQLESDEEDLYVAELDCARMSATYRAKLKPLNLDDDPPMHMIHAGVEPEICIPGFSLDRAGIDYDLRVFAPKPTVLAAWYVGGGIDPSGREVKFVPELSAICPSMDGFSGSPVFWVPTIGTERFYTFVGMLLSGNTARGFFLSGSVIVRGLDHIMDQNPDG